jgi:hypothetical protein
METAGLDFLPHIFLPPCWSAASAEACCAAAEPPPRPKIGLSSRSAEDLIQGGKKMEGKKMATAGWDFFTPHLFASLLVRGERAG